VPIYRYSCSDCDTVFSILEFAGDPTTEQCKQCGSNKIERIPSVPGVQFKGKGFYVTDRKGGRSGAAKPVESGKSNGAKGQTNTNTDSGKANNKEKAKKPSKPAAS